MKACYVCARSRVVSFDGVAYPVPLSGSPPLCAECVERWLPKPKPKPIVIENRALSAEEASALASDIGRLEWLAGTGV